MPQEIAANTPTLASALTLLAVVGQGVLAHLKGRRGKRDGVKRDEAITGRLERIENTVANSARESRRLWNEQLQINHEFDTRIRGAYAHVIGEDGENGVRGDLRHLEIRVDGIEERERDLLTQRRAS